MAKQQVLIIGAGAAGLEAAQKLSAEGIKVTILEARDRIGGRINSNKGPFSGLPVELGAEFIHGERNDTWQLVRAANLATLEVPDRHWHCRNGRLSEEEDYWDELDKVMGKIDPSHEDEDFESFLEKVTELRDDAREFAKLYVEGFHAARAERIGTQAVLRAEGAAERDGNKQFWLKDGYAALLDWFSLVLVQREVPTLLNTSVKRVRWRRGEVEILAETPEGPRTFAAEQAIVTLPLGVLKASGEDGVVFEPGLGDKERAVRGLAMGHVVKLTLEFKERIWPSENFGFMHSANWLMPTWWADNRGPLLTGWAGGAQADKVNRELLAKGGKEALVEHATMALSEIFQTNTSKIKTLLAGAHFHNWTDDSFSRGAYSYTPVRMLEMPELLAAPVAETLYFAGEATDATGEQGTVHGALASGKRAARELLETRTHHLRVGIPELNFKS